MSELLNKSELNMLAADYLYKGCHYATVCHPAYYSCLQLMKFKIKDKLAISYEEQDKEISSTKSNSHGYIISKIVLRIEKKKGSMAARNFKNAIYDLKLLREKSDYLNIRASQDNCDRAITLAKQLIQTINRDL
jgi:hypothetical protein